MENEREPDTPEQQPYTPRPLWQVWGARLLLTVFLILLLVYYIHITRGGQ